jgi:hypothetical protein
LRVEGRARTLRGPHPARRPARCFNWLALAARTAGKGMRAAQRLDPLQKLDFAGFR